MTALGRTAAMTLDVQLATAILAALGSAPPDEGSENIVVYEPRKTNGISDLLEDRL